MGGILAVLAWLGGMAAQLQQPELASWRVYVGVLVGACVAAALCRRMARPCLVVPMFVAAFALTGLRAIDRLSDELPAALEGQDLVVTGVIAQMPRVGASGTRFVLEVENAWRSDTAVRVPQKIALGWYSGFGGPGSAGANAVPELRAGQRWRLNVRLRQPHGTMNPHGFDLELWLFEQGIRASGAVRSGAGRFKQLEAPVGNGNGNVIGNGNGNGDGNGNGNGSGSGNGNGNGNGNGSGNIKLKENVAHPFERLRQSIRDAIDQRIEDKTAAGILAALAIGDQGAVDRDDWALFRQTGIAHAISISGVYVTLEL